MSPRVGARRRLKVVSGLGVLVLGMLGGTFAVLEPAAQASNNLACPQGTSEYKVDGNPLNGLSNGESAQFTVNGVTFTFTKVAGPAPFTDDTFDFTSSVAVSAALVKGGEDTNVYSYDPAVTSGSALHPPLNGGDEAPAISHVTFCIGGSGTTTTSTTAPTSSSSSTTTSTVPDSTSTSTSTSSTSTSTTVPETTTSTTVPETTTSTTVPETTTSTTVPETTTSTTVPETTTTISEQGSTTTSTVPETTTSTTEVHGTTVFVTTTTTQPETTTTLREQGGTVATTTTTEPVTVPGTLPRTGSTSAGAALFGLLCITAGALLVLGRRKPWSHS
jgi:LPXTG-motif cell wall-anchored protein